MDPPEPEFETSQGQPALSMFNAPEHVSVGHLDIRAAGGDIIAPTISSTLIVNVSQHPLGSHFPLNQWSRPPVSPPSHSHVSSHTTKETPTNAPSGSERLLQKVLPKSLRRFFRSKRSSDRIDNHKNQADSHQPLRRWRSRDSASTQASGITICSLDSLFDHFVDFSVLPIPDVYVCNMLKLGKGLPCWQPRPDKALRGERESVQHLGDATSVRKTAQVHGLDTYDLPDGSVVVNQGRLATGDTLCRGTAARTRYRDDDGTMDCFEFHCRSSHGAVLALTSPADLEELADYTALQEHIMQHAELIYRHANSIRRIADDESIYIVTGCMKSESWAMAAFSDPATSPQDVLKLVKKRTPRGRDHAYVWTERGTSEACVGQSEKPGANDQSLFLRGFRLDFSQKFRSQLRGNPGGLLGFNRDAAQSFPQLPSPFTPVIDDGDDNDKGAGVRGAPMEVSELQQRRDAATAEEGATSRSTGSVEVSVPCGWDGAAERRPMKFPQSHLHTYYPSDVINRYLLKHSDAPVALCHEDDWLCYLEDPDWGSILLEREETSSGAMNVNSHGVATIANEPESTAATDSLGASNERPASPSVPGHYVVDFAEGGTSPPPDQTPIQSHQYYPSPRSESPGDPSNTIPPISDVSAQDGQSIDPEQYLRQQLGLQPGEPTNLWSLPDPEPGQRPPHSYPLLVRLAIYGSPNKRMTLQQIYEAIENRFEYYRNQPKGAWKGSIRHNLSLNQVFRNVHRPVTEPGRGNYWEIDHSTGEGYRKREL